ncbi:MAG: gamma-glutamyl-gamma-aminobutyrate hydrolase family protein [Methanospirillaceae archaeon]|nr:gamma-glutamyl-gamma-aminobutyrate hydrolase family protein [Methanospirillaceae archaeon]
MLQVIDLSYKPQSLSFYEFVSPVSTILSKQGIPHTISHFRERICDTTEGCILCGTALADNEYLNDTAFFSWIPSYSRPILGICAGMQIVSIISGGTIRDEVTIGMQEIVPANTKTGGIFGRVEPFTGYELHRFMPEIPSSFVVLARSGERIAAIKHRTNPWFGVMFHPEVRNEWVILQFVQTCRDYQPDKNRNQ